MEATAEKLAPNQVELSTKHGTVTLTVTGKESAHVTGDLTINRIPYRLSEHFRRGDQYNPHADFAQRWRRDGGAMIRRMDVSVPFGSFDKVTSTASSFVYGDLARLTCETLEANAAIVAAGERDAVRRQIETLRADIAISEQKLTALRDLLAVAEDIDA